MWAIVKLTTTRHRVCFVMRASEAMFWIVYHMWINGHVCWLHLKLNTSYDTSHTNFKCRRLGWLHSWNLIVSFVCARGMVARWNSSSNPTNGFSILHFTTPIFPFSIVWHGVFTFPHVTSKWNRRTTEVNSKWNQSEIEVNRHEIEVTSTWNQNEIDMTPKWSRSEIDVKSKCIRSEIEVKSNWNQSELNAQSKWIRSEIEVTSKWARNKFEVKMNG